jgi:hypothetical protein
MASRASGLLSSARTSQTLWLHSISRQLSTQTHSHALARPLLAKLLQPSLRLTVLEVLPFGSTRSCPPTTTTPTHRHSGESKIVLTNCRLLLSSSASEDDGNEEELPETDLQGLVLFSLHEHPPASSQPIFLPPRKRHSKDHNDDDDTRNVFLPSNPHDLRFVQVGAEVWVWDPCYEVVLRDEESEETLGLKVGGDEMWVEGEGEAGEVYWDSRSKEEREKEREERERREREGEAVRRGLVSGRFAVLV